MRGIHRLTARKVAARKERGLLADGGGLFLQISRNGSHSWLFRYRREGRTRHMGLGPLHTVSLQDARERARLCRALLKDGIDPLSDRVQKAATARLEAARSMTFDQCAAAYIAAYATTWKSAKHRGQWSATLATYASPIIGNIPVQSVDVAQVLKVLEPIWQTKPETASRVRGRIESVLDWATARTYRRGENPARWRGHLDKVLPRKSKVRKPEHHAAMPFQQIGSFISEIRTRSAVSASALEFLILTAGRTSEVLGARWNEIDFGARTWTVPAERMKAGREHRVPLSWQALAVLERMIARRETDFVFPGGKYGKPLSNMSLLILLRRMGRADLTAHGFRSTFRTWAGEKTSVQREVAEASLAHTVGSNVERAYQRGDLFEKRRSLMQVWADFCGRPSSGTSAVIPLRAAN